MADSRQTRRGARRPVAFISHHSSQDKVARHLKGVLGRHGVDGWMAPDDIEPGVSFDRAIIDQLRRSDMIILLFCARSDQSKHVKRELMLAEDQNKLVYPVRLEAIEPTGLAYWLQDYQWTDWIDRRDATIEAMVATVKRQVADADAAALAEKDAPAEPAPIAPETPVPQAISPQAVVPLMADAGPPPALVTVPGGGGGLGRYGWIALAVIGVALAALVGLGILAMSGKSEPRGRIASSDNDDESDSGDPEPDVVETGFFRPGQWRTTNWMNQIEAPGLPDEMRDQLIQQFNAAAQVSERCVPPEEADNPQSGFFNLDQGGSCSSGEPYIANGEIDISLSCNAPGMNQATELRMEGSYTPDEFTLNLTMITDLGAPGGQITMRGVATGEHLGDCG